MVPGGLGTPLTLGDEGIRPGRPFKLLIPPAPPTGRLQSPARGPQKCRQSAQRLEQPASGRRRSPAHPAPPTAGSPALRAACREARARSAPRRRVAILPPPHGPVGGLAGAASDAPGDVLTRPSGAAPLSLGDRSQERSSSPSEPVVEPWGPEQTRSPWPGVLGLMTQQRRAGANEGQLPGARGPRVRPRASFCETSLLVANGVQLGSPGPASDQTGVLGLRPLVYKEFQKLNVGPNPSFCLYRF
ncbi:predicted GPI-anchored protein 58 [Cervus canadensis]|uniref:predicted GPI-anchored protein 58 n=1 Tax=Cervus canadensis TaxID=1574408 RepID=UPI001C9E3FB6|nr:predicted GPI-anchored protein 58 [Cervus canadensis]